jgi:formamidopyrimidine-DNA glycosylase
VPEGDTIHHLARTFAPLLEGRRIDGAVRGYGPWRRGEIESAVGHVVESVEARGKNLLVHLDGGLAESRIDGYWRRVGAERRAPEEETLLLTVGGDSFALFKAAEASVIRENDLARLLGDLGPDLLAEGFDPALAARRAIARPGAIADVLLDQGVASGIGNVYKSESLYIQRIHPWDTLTDEGALTALYELNATASPEPRTTAADHHQRRRPPDGARLGLRPHGPRLPHVRRVSPIAPPGPGRADDLLVPALPAAALNTLRPCRRSTSTGSA